MKKLTAVEYLVKQLKERGYAGEFPPHLLFEQAKAMEKEQIIDAFFSGYNYEGGQLEEKSEQYYNETFTEQPKK
jgi:hypothetical protein